MREKYLEPGAFFWPGQEVQTSPLAEDVKAVDPPGIQIYALSKSVCVFCASGKFVETLETLQKQFPRVPVTLVTIWDIDQAELNRFWRENHMTIRARIASPSLKGLYHELDPKHYTYHPLDNTVLLIHNGQIRFVKKNPNQQSLATVVSELLAENQQP